MFHIPSTSHLQCKTITLTPMAMDDPEPRPQDDDVFYDASDDFLFYDCVDMAQSDPSISISPSLESHPWVEPQQLLEVPMPETFRRRRRFSRQNSVEISGSDSKLGNSTICSETSEVQDVTPHKERKLKLPHELKRDERKFEKSESSSVRTKENEQENEDSVVTTASDGRIGDLGPQLDESSSDLFLYLAGLVIKVVGFQIKLLIGLFTCPIWTLYNFYMFVTDPFQITRHIRRFILDRALELCNLVIENVSPQVYEWLKEQKSIWKLGLRLLWGFLWAVYVCVSLCGILVSSFLLSGLVIRYLVEEPVQIKEVLNFDYTKNTPVAFVPIISCLEAECSVNCKQKAEAGRRVEPRVIPPDHKLQVTVSLTLPESDYNRNLGIFQVRVDLLSSNGKVLSSSRQPCMLPFRSQPIRFLLMFFKAAPLIAGYASESQILKVEMRAFPEGGSPVSCLKVVIEQRAEFQPSAGIPEIYDASIFFESRPPFFRRIIWYWKKTLFIWISMVIFMMELLVTLLCCRPIILPGVGTMGRPVNNSPPNNHPVQEN